MSLRQFRMADDPEVLKRGLVLHRAPFMQVVMRPIVSKAYDLRLAQLGQFSNCKKGFSHGPFFCLRVGSGQHLHQVVADAGAQ